MKYKKDPDAILDYLVDFAAKTNNSGGKQDYLQEGEVITSYTVFSNSEDITINSTSLINNDTSVVIWLSGGLLNKVYSITTRISTSLGRTDDRSFQLLIVEK